jgi:hypothetical protein
MCICSILLPEQKVQDMQEQERSAVKMQALMRGRAHRKEKQEKDKAAAALQARFRGKKARIQVQDLSEAKYEQWRRCDALECLFRLRDRDMDGFLSTKDLMLMLQEIPRRRPAKGRKGNSAPPPRRVNPNKKDVKKLVRAMNANTSANEKDNHARDGSSSVGVSEETFVAYMNQGLKMTRLDVIAFRRKGHIQAMLADLIGFVSKEVESRILSERAAALNAVFNHFDVDQSGEIDGEEFTNLIIYFSGKGGKEGKEGKGGKGGSTFAPTKEEIGELMGSLDQGGDGMLQREEFIAFSMGGLSQTAKQRREYAKQSSMHNKLCVLLDRISLGIDRRTKALHSIYDVLVQKGRMHRKDKHERMLRTMDMECLYQAIVENGMGVERGEAAKVQTAVKRFIKALTGDTHGTLGKNDFVLFQLSGGSDPAVLKKQHPVIDLWRSNLLKSMAW